MRISWSNGRIVSLQFHSITEFLFPLPRFFLHFHFYFLRLLSLSLFFSSIFINWLITFISVHIGRWLYRKTPQNEMVLAIMSGMKEKRRRQRKQLWSVRKREKRKRDMPTHRHRQVDNTDSPQHKWWAPQTKKTPTKTTYNRVIGEKLDVLQCDATPKWAAKFTWEAS